jgi:hypothetical protein
MSEGERDQEPTAGETARLSDAEADVRGLGDPEADARLRELERLIGRLEGAAEQLRSGDLSTDAAATLVEECAVLANRAGTELERLSRADRGGGSAPAPGQDSLL